MILSSGENIANKNGPIPSNKLNIDGTNFSSNDVWDLSGSNISKIFSNSFDYQKTEFGNISQINGPIIGDWESETKFKTFLKVVIVWFSNYISLYVAAIFPLIFISLSLINSLDSYILISLILQWFLAITIISVVLYFEDKFSYFRKLFVTPNLKQSLILIIFILILDFILVTIYLFIYDSVAGSPGDDILGEIPLTLLFISLTIAAPFLEEILFRGYLLDKIRSSYSDNVAIISTGFLFGFMHHDILAPLDFGQTGAATISGFLYAWLRIKTGSLWPSIVCHSIWNGLIFFIFFL